MKFNMHRPPSGTDDTKESLERLVSWLNCLCENLNAVLANIGEENLSPSLKKRLGNGKEETDGR
ncbi:MAG: hypothetical protein IJD22_04655 [Clostridia bacterium]|nr:hypothetical protein [Clostridia bacterium]